ncbi:MAG: spondin domain-containing protein [Planctomycetota bacterium]
MFTRFRRRPRLNRRDARQRLQGEILERRQLLASDVLQITVENLADPGGLANTPVWIAAHDGTFDLGNLGESASGFGGLELIAEEGDPSELVDRFQSDGIGNDAVVFAPDGFAGAPIFEAGEVVTETFVVDDTLQGRYFSFATMVIPSNDAFIGNLNPTAYPIYNSSGDFLGPQTIVVYGREIWDAGTEVNDPNGGAAFTTAGGTSVDENGVVHAHPGLDDFVGVGLPTGDVLGKAFGPNTPIARITIAQASNPSSPIDDSPPSAELLAEDLESRADYHEISVVYSDASGIDLNSITPEDLRVTGPLLTQLNVLSVSTDATPGSIPHEVVATYRVAPASGSFTHLDNGTYSVVLLEDEVNDPLGQTSPAQLLGEFTVDAPVRLNVTYENLGETGGLAATPVFIAAHNGSFEIAQAGRPASDFGGLELVAEEGDLSELIARFEATSDGTSSVIFAPDGFAGAPVFEPGETVTQTLDVSDPMFNRYFSYASMVIPSNDAFIANLNSRGIELFDLAGNFTGSRSITIYGQDVWDAGTEVNDAQGGAAFSTEGGTSSDENGVIQRHTGLDEFIGTGTPIGTLEQAFENMTPIGRITISLADSPADPIDNKGPFSNADIAPLTVAGESVHEIRVTYSDASGVDLTSIDVNDIRVTGLNQSRQFNVIGVTTDSVLGEDTQTVTATYQIAPEGDEFTSFDNGLYSVELVEGEVNDTLGNENSGTSFGTLEILVPVELIVTIENLADDGGLYLTPFWFGVHEGNFQVGRAGVSANEFAGLELIAEEGDVSELANRFDTESAGFGGVVFAPDGFAGAPVFDPGESSFESVAVFDTNVNRFFSFASMVIPSNDAFVANLNPRAYELFDANGFYLGDQTITLTGGDVWDAGTEVNAVNGGAAFSTEGGNGTDENGVVRRHAGLDDFVGSGIPTGQTLASAFNDQTPLARITISLAGRPVLPFDDNGPLATAAADEVSTAGTTSHDVVITYTDPSGVDPTTVGVEDIVVTGPLGRELEVLGVVTDATPGETPTVLTATYEISTPDGEFTARDNGRYFVDVLSDEVRDTLGLGRETQVAGEFTVDVGVRLQVEIQSLAPDGGLAQTPFWIGFHDGTFEVARGGVSASEFGGLELIAEEGDASELIARFVADNGGTGALITAPDGFSGAPIFEPGESAQQIIEVENSSEHRFFSFASMVIPSNDAFVANLDPRRYELFDSSGNFRGARQITLYAHDIYDAGTEVNDPLAGAAFSTEGGDSIDENGLIRRHAGLDDFIGTGTPIGTLESIFEPSDPIATITISLFDPEAQVCSGVDGACSARSVSLQNAELNADVNRDGRVSALDSLLVINFLGRFGNQSTITDEAQATGLDLDVGGDQQITPLDVILVINDLMRRSISQGAEGEFIDSVDQVFSQPNAFDPFDDEEEDLFPELRQIA